MYFNVDYDKIEDGMWHTNKNKNDYKLNNLFTTHGKCLIYIPFYFVLVCHIWATVVWSTPLDF